MVLFLYGSDTFRSKRILSEIVEKYRLKYKSGLNFAKIELSEENFHDFQNKVETVSMFQERKLIILKNVFSLSKSLQKRVSEYLEKKELFENKNVILIFFEEGVIKGKNNLFKLLFRKSFKKQEFKELPLNDVNAFIKQEIKKLNGKIHPLAVEKLLLYYENNLWQLENEINKLVSFKKRGLIQSEDVENLCEANITLNIFKTIESISRKNKKRALSLISEHLEAGENEVKILSMITFQFRNLLKIKSLTEQGKNIFQIRKLSRLHPFVIKKALPIAQKFSMEELKNIYQKLFELDLKIKTGKTEPRLGIEMFVIEL